MVEGTKVTDKINLTCEDNMELMARYPDNYFELAIVDPPYGIGMDCQKESYNQGKNGEGKRHRKQWDRKGWDDKTPNKEYFAELKRISKNQIIWGGNYFTEFLHPTPHWLVWDKKNPNLSFAEGELAWVRYGKNLRLFQHYSARVDGGGKIHPTQKPVKLYEWLLMNYAKEGDKILDTHLGSMSIAIACHNLGYELTGCELDQEYYEQGIKRVKNHIAQQRLF